MFAFLVACSPVEDQQNVYDEIVAVEQAYMAAFEYGDARSMAKLYSEQAQLLPSNRGFVSGRQEIKQFWQGLMRLGIAVVKLETIEIDHSGHQAIEVGRYTIHTVDEEMIDYGKYLVVWQRQEAQWFIHRHIWTTSMIKAHESRI
jgi:uncharacterized protein (TIGR02246 family)